MTLIDEKRTEISSHVSVSLSLYGGGVFFQPY